MLPDRAIAVNDAEASPGIPIPVLARLLRYAKVEAAALGRADAAYLIDVALLALEERGIRFRPIGIRRGLKPRLSR